MSELVDSGKLNVRHLSSWVSHAEYLHGAGPTGFLRITTKENDVYEVHDAGKEAAQLLGSAVENVEAVQGTDEEPEMSVGQAVNMIFRKYDTLKIGDN